MKQQLGVNIKQAIRMNTNMHQSVEVLQMSYADLSQIISDEAASNPFLEVDSDSYQGNDDNQTNDEGYYSKDFEDDELDIFANVTTAKSIYLHIEEQINLEIVDEIEKRIAFEIVNYMIPSGYLENYDPKALSAKLNCSEDILSRVLAKLQNLNPSGVFARSLQECLKLQLKNQGLLSQSFETLIDNLELVGKLQYEKLYKICNVSHDELIKMISQIKLLSPNPATRFNSDPLIPKIPEVILRINKDVLSVEINQNILPKMLLNKDYYVKIKKEINEENKEKDEKEQKGAENKSDLISQEYAKASNLCNAVTNRFKTLLVVAKAIVEYQQDFFIKGIMYLKPMIIDEISKATNFHDSTISRTVSGKYMLTPIGIYELKYFFSSKVNTNVAGISESSTKIKEYIKELITGEGDDILSDDDVSEMLEKFGFQVARRTVAKYRESLGIPTSAIRKRQKRSAKTSA